MIRLLLCSCFYGPCERFLSDLFQCMSLFCVAGSQCRSVGRVFVVKSPLVARYQINTLAHAHDAWLGELQMAFQDVAFPL